MPPHALLATLLLLPWSGVSGDALPFDGERISRRSLDAVPRSLSIRQGTDVWLGYDLERAKPFKVWQAPSGKPGLAVSGFVTRSSGSAWHEDRFAVTWELERNGVTIPLSIRYLGVTDLGTGFELTWELRHDTGALTLRERVPLAPPAGTRVLRELRVDSLGPDESLRPPLPARSVWILASPDGTPVPALSGAAWHRFTLPE